MKTESLEVSYRATTYRVFLPGGEVELRIGEANVALARWLAGEGASTWAILTAHNPASKPLTVTENAELQSQLECALLEQDCMTFSGENAADDEVWPNEESCFVPDINIKNSMALARRFGQNAYVFGEGDGLPRLVWVEENIQ
ncbi:MAG: hypothetical protein H6R18_2515 [Proteobacteria bacterium]|nr:hypothetical protein [Pseudomonadota bacterium]